MKNKLYLIKSGDNQFVEETEAVIAASGGNVGIGTVGPNDFLELNVDASNNPGFGITINQSTANPARLSLSNSEGSATIDADGNLLKLGNASAGDLVIDSNGRVGIGTTSPIGKLDIREDGDGVFMNLQGSTAGNVKLRMSPQGSSTSSSYIEAINNGTDTDLQLNESLYLKHDGNVGLGTTSPSSLLHLQKSVAAGDAEVLLLRNPLANAVGESVSIAFQGATQIDMAKIEARTRGANASGAPCDLVFQTASSGSAATDRMIIDNAGNVGIGTTSPQNDLHLSSSLPTIRLEDSDVANGESYSTIHSSSNGGIQISLDPDNNRSQTDLRINIDGSEKMRIDSAGNVGIGTTNPVLPLEIQTDSDALYSSGVSGNLLRLRNMEEDTTDSHCGIDLFAGVSTVSGHNPLSRIYAVRENNVDGKCALTFATRSTSTTSEVMRIDSDGNVGIGTSNPSSKITTVSTVDSTFGNVTPSAANSVAALVNTPTAEAANNHATLQFNLNAGTHNHIGSISLVSESASVRRGALAFCTDNGTSRPEAMRIDSSGNVGIGTSNPTGLLHLESNNATIKMRSTAAHTLTTGPLINFQGKNSAGDTKSFANIKSYSTGVEKGVLAFTVRESASATDEEAMRIDSNGYVGIGTTDPALIHHISTSSNSANYASSRFTADSQQFDVGVGGSNVSLTGLRNKFYIFDSTVSQTRLVMNSSGNVGIGTTNPTAKLHVNGSVSKSSGSFKIDHPLKPETHNLVHSFVEAPQADNIYRGKVDLVAGKAEVNIDSAAGMTEGTFVALNREVQVFTSNESSWAAVRGRVEDNKIIIECQNNESTATVSWLVVGERQDQHMYDTEWTDENGKVIVEPLKAEPPVDQEQEVSNPEEA